MIKNILIILVLSLFSETKAQDAIGTWYSECQENHYMLNIKKDNGKYSGKIINLSKSVYGVNISGLKGFDISRLSFDSPYFSFNGLINQSKSNISGFAFINNDSIPIAWTPQPSVRRNQIVKKTVPYISEEIQFQNLKDNFNLSGTLTLPDTLEQHPVVILVSGSGPQDRNEEILGHKTFLVLADYLTRNGLAVLRYDDRGTAQSEGTFKGSTCYDFAIDASSAINFLKCHSNIDTTKIGLLGHSEGGNVIAITAEDNKDVDFMVFLSAPGVNNLDMYKVQLKNILNYAPEEYDYNRDYWYFDSIYTNMVIINDTEILKDKIGNLFDSWAAQYSTDELSVIDNLKQYKESEIKKHSAVSYREFMKFDVTPYLRKINIPILAIGGDKDRQVDSKQNLAGFEKTLKESKHTAFKTIEVKNINHFFQPCTDGNINKNYFNETTFSEEVMNDISEWIKKL